MLLIADTFDQGGVPLVRRRVAECARTAGLTGGALDGYVLAVSEVVANAVRHAGGTGRLCLWQRGDTLVCEVVDEGPGIPAERIRRLTPPPPGSPAGWGLWLAQHFSQMDVHSSPAGTTVRLTVPLRSR